MLIDLIIPFLTAHLTNLSPFPWWITTLLYVKSMTEQQIYGKFRFKSNISLHLIPWNEKIK